MITGLCFGQIADSIKDSNPAPTNAPGVEFPRVDSQSRAIFRVEATEAQKVHAFFLGIGSEEGQRMKTLSEALNKAGIHNTYFESQGTAHEWLTWRRCLHEFAPLLFKN